MAWRSRFGLMVALVCLLLSGSVQAEDYLSAGEIAAVSGGSIALMGLRGVVNRFDSTRQPLISGPLPGEETIQRWLGGDPKPGKRNFLDDKAGSIVTPLTLAVALTAIDLSWPRQDKGKETAQDLFLYISGLVAVKGVTGVAKGLVARRRPILHFAPELAPHTNEGEWRHHRQSFFSGHTSSSFFAAAYLNLRMRTIMRAELSPMDYRSWRWAPPTLLFGWSSFVGLSRIHAYRHYLSDVLAGALVGTIMAELFFALNDSPSISDDDGNASSTPMLLRMRYRF
jgi:membrane-associated phospholipid phosphatase